jgi:uncharacterized beta-barrel protein YwiB (DUF1934 family)
MVQKVNDYVFWLERYIGMSRAPYICVRIHAQPLIQIEEKEVVVLSTETGVVYKKLKTGLYFTYQEAENARRENSAQYD